MLWKVQSAGFSIQTKKSEFIEFWGGKGMIAHNTTQSSMLRVVCWVPAGRTALRKISCLRQRKLGVCLGIAECCSSDCLSHALWCHSSPGRGTVNASYWENGLHIKTPAFHIRLMEGGMRRGSTAKLLTRFLRSSKLSKRTSVLLTGHHQVFSTLTKEQRLLINGGLLS